MSYKNFNRHEIFTTEDLNNVREAINNLQFEKGYSMMDSLVNSLYGLYDGYLYDGIDEELYQVLDLKVFCNLTKTLKKITDHIEAKGETQTQH